MIGHQPTLHFRAKQPRVWPQLTLIATLLVAWAAALGIAYSQIIPL